MEQQKYPSTQSDLDRIREQFEHWRRTRRRGMKIPESLWDLAVELTQTYSFTEICQTLRVDFNHLKRRAENRKEATVSATQFVELELTREGAECVIELERSDGARMRMSLKGAHGGSLIEIARAFWSGS